MSAARVPAVWVASTSGPLRSVFQNGTLNKRMAKFAAADFLAVCGKH